MTMPRPIPLCLITLLLTVGNPVVHGSISMVHSGNDDVITVTVGSNVTISCTTTESTLIRWDRDGNTIFNGHRLTDDTKYKVVSDDSRRHSELTVICVGRHDVGVYECSEDINSHQVRAVSLSVAETPVSLLAGGRYTIQHRALLSNVDKESVTGAAVDNEPIGVPAENFQWPLVAIVIGVFFGAVSLSTVVALVCHLRKKASRAQVQTSDPDNAHLKEISPHQPAAAAAQCSSSNDDSRGTHVESSLFYEEIRIQDRELPPPPPEYTRLRTA